MAAPTRAAVLSLYRNLLRTVRTFPSKKRNSIREDIRVTMREGAALRDPAKLAQAWEVGVRGLETMQKYTSLDKKAADWSITLDQAPLGEAPTPPAEKFAPVESGATGVKQL